MKTCKFCGKELNDGVHFCPQCGNRVEGDAQGESANGGGYNLPNNNSPAGAVRRASTLQIVAKVFMIVTIATIATFAVLAVLVFFMCVVMSAVYGGGTSYVSIGIIYAIICVIPLAWTIPMFVTYNRKIKAGERISTAFKVCTLLFFNTVAGILLLCDN